MACYQKYRFLTSRLGRTDYWLLSICSYCPAVTRPARGPGPLTSPTAQDATYTDLSSSGTLGKVGSLTLSRMWGSNAQEIKFDFLLLFSCLNYSISQNNQRQEGKLSPPRINKQCSC